MQCVWNKQNSYTVIKINIYIVWCVLKKCLIKVQIYKSNMQKCCKINLEDTHVKIKVMLSVERVNIYLHNTHCHWFLQQNMVAFLCKSYRGFLCNTNQFNRPIMMVCTQKTIKNKCHTLILHIRKHRYCMFTLWRRSGVQINTASANFSLSTILCQSRLKKKNSNLVWSKSI